MINLLKKYPVISFYILVFLLSWGGDLMLIGPKLISGQPFSKMDGLLMFPVMILAAAASGIIMIWITEGKPGLSNFSLRLFKWRIAFKWYAIALIIPPGLILITLFVLKNWISKSFTPNFFFIGILFGVPAGFFEEIGWTGFALHKMFFSKGMILSSLIIGSLWGLWHWPVIDFLGVASPHGTYLLPFFLSFIALLMAVRMLIVWIYSYTQSILICQFFHGISTGCLAMLGPVQVSSGQETLWYASYAALLWLVAICLLTRFNYEQASNL
jgi:hypothetical protein